VASACAVCTGELQEFVGVQCWDIALHGQLDAVPPLSLQELAALCLYDFHAAGFATSALHTPSGTPEPNALCQACNTACINHLSALSQAMAKSFTVRGGLTFTSFETPSELCSGAFNEVSSALDGLQEEGEQKRAAASWVRTASISRSWACRKTLSVWYVLTVCKLSLQSTWLYI